MGIAQYEPTLTLVDFMRQADQMMYQAKLLGKNRVEELAG